MTAVLAMVGTGYPFVLAFGAGPLAGPICTSAGIHGQVQLDRRVILGQ